MLKPTDRTRAHARRSRREPTMAEAAMWSLLRDRRLGDWKFRRQMPTVMGFGNEAVLRNPAVVLEAVRRHAARTR